MIMFIGIMILGLLFWLTVGFGMVKIAPVFYFYFVMEMIFLFAVSKIVEFIQKPPKGIFETIFDVLYIICCFWFAYAGAKGVERHLQGLNPIVREINYAEGAVWVIGGALLGVVIVLLREQYTKWIKRRKQHAIVLSNESGR